VRAAFQYEQGRLVPTAAEPDASIVVFAAPDREERREMVELLGLDPHDLDSALDPDEISRVEFRHDRMTLIWKRPKNVSVAEQLRFDVASVGLFLHGRTLVVVLSDDAMPFTEREFQGVRAPVDFLLRFLLHTVHHYLGHLKVIKQITVELGEKLSASMENRYFLQMLALSESLIYYVNAIDANGAVLQKLASNAERLGFAREQVEALHDLQLDNGQCSRQAQVYSSVLSDLMLARGTIISNSVNVLLKNLTLINVIFLPLTLIASIGGMSEYGAATSRIEPWIAYGALAVGMVGLGVVTWYFLVRFLDRLQSRR
jgi:magnesium transporter